MANLQLANNLRRYRKARGFTQDKLSKRLNISRQAYSNYERANRDPDIGLLIKLCDIYNLTMEELIIQPFNPKYTIRETGSYRIASQEDSDNSIVLSEEEMGFILKYRDASPDTRTMIDTLLESTAWKSQKTR